MRAIQIHEYGGPEVLQRVEIDVPKPAPGEVLVRVVAAGINFMDIHTRQGKYRESRTYPVRIPCTLGMEGSGEVIEVGAGVTSCRKGDRVAWCIAWGAYAEYALVPAARLAKLPDGIDYDVAAAAIFQGSTAHYLLEDVAHIGAGSTCLVHAASGGIGQLLVQLAKRRGAEVFATTSSPAKAAIAKSLGADHVLMYEDGAFADRVRDLTQGRGVDVVFDAVGRTTLRDSFRATRTRGLVVNYGSVTGPMSDLDPYELGEAGSLFLTRPRLADHLADVETVQRRADDIFDAIQQGALHIGINGRYTLDTVEAAHAALEERRQSGKAVMDIA
ncbi:MULTISPECIES: quinone oxidoreductase [Paraburkholderia]|uniref:quinone oxidoreductase family protein n=1 Tax=Paraburkholderia TaxID=1822464 RepID=UPI00224DE065|nr:MULTISPECIES: quinone oxidoreductase [Paraburkholderia]MCX4166116.1 quinone oxidoreductase [Paraburkholderia megapolitana]MDN7161606.1 quinone oxidoreductase [Paraburkholderia sp. CHISQ3]MDQ6498654.1 quinone oxidoreductase [Paraburkholderia megapolitana]